MGLMEVSYVYIQYILYRGKCIAIICSDFLQHIICRHIYENQKGYCASPKFHNYTPILTAHAVNTATRKKPCTVGSNNIGIEHAVYVCFLKLRPQVKVP